LLFLVSCSSFGQNDSIPDFDSLDLRYREDQFYFNVTYNILQNAPLSVSQNSFSAGVATGFLRDFPINTSRTVAIAPGLGFSFSNYKQNLIVDDTSGERTYALIPSDVIFDRNKFALYTVDLPIELRWRTSTPESHKFWRIYAGVKFSYLLYTESKYVDANKAITVNNNPDFNKFQYGAYLTAGYNSWNIYAFYGMSKLLSKSIDASGNGFNTLNVGLMFYIL